MQDTNLFSPVTNLREQYRLLTTLLWRNNYRQAAFTVSRTSRADIHQFLWYTKEHNSNIRVERLYYAIPDGIYVDYEGVLYKIVQVAHYKPTTTVQVLLQMQSTENLYSYCDYMGYDRNKPVTVPEQQRGREQYTDRGNYSRHRKK